MIAKAPSPGENGWDESDEHVKHGIEPVLHRPAPNLPTSPGVGPVESEEPPPRPPVIPNGGIGG